MGSTVASREGHIFHSTSCGFCSHRSEIWSPEMIDSVIARQTMRRTQTSAVQSLVGSEIHTCPRVLLPGFGGPTLLFLFFIVHSGIPLDICACWLCTFSLEDAIVLQFSQV